MGTLQDRIADRSARIAILGQGYVGLPLAVAFAESGFQVVGLDVNADRVNDLAKGVSDVEDIPNSRLQPLVESGSYRASTDFGELTHSDATIICVPTPLSKTRDPDISYIVNSCDQIAPRLKPDSLIVLESTTYPGTTQEVILPRLCHRGGEVGQDFYLAFSPERIDPGNKTYQLENTPKVIGGVTDKCRDLACQLYATVVDQTVPVGSTTSAEMVKLLENTYRAVNIGLVNEIALICDRLNLDVWEIIDAAATKPFGYQPFYPGPGLGGHCIPVDPHYLSWKLRVLNYNARFIQVASEVNSQMPEHWAAKVADCLNEQCRSVKAAKVLVLGMAYKRDVSDIRESPALEIFELLHRKGADISFCDPHVESIRFAGEVFESRPYSEEVLAEAHCIVIATDHSEFIPAELVVFADKIVDTRNLLAKAPSA